MQNFSDQNSAPNSTRTRSPNTSLLSPSLDNQICQQNSQKCFSFSSDPRSFDLTTTEKTQDTSNEIFKDLSIDFSKVYKQFELTLNKKLESPLCKCRYFSLKIYLKPLQNLVFPENEKVELEFFVYSEDGKLISRNLKGTEIVKGNNVQKLSYFTVEKVHLAYFRIQVTEVSSHYFGKNFCFKIKPKMNDFLKKMGWRIKSFCVKNVVVKAKESKRMN